MSPSEPLPLPIERPDGPVVLGISADYHDAAAALVVGGSVLAAAEEERFTRRKHDPDLPVRSIGWLLEQAQVGADDLAAVAFYAKPLTTIERILASHARAGLRGLPSLGRALATWGRHKAWVAYRIERALRDLGRSMPELVFAEHHQSHAASAFYPSPFESAAVLTFDGVGEWATSTIGVGRGDRLDLLEELRYPDSIGLWYSTMTAFCGFEVNDGEYKLMGLAPYGTPRYADAMRQHLIRVFDDGSVHLDQRYYRYLGGTAMFHPRIAEVLGGPPRRSEDPLTEREADIAASAQAVLEEVVLRAARHAHEVTGQRAACLAGGVALNCVANRALRAEGPFDDLWVQPAASDAGGAVGAALWAAHMVRGEPRPQRSGSDAMAGSLLGPAFSPDDVDAWLRAEEPDAVTFPDVEAVNALVAEHLAAGAVVGCFRGRAELGPRALGNRSILADPRSAATIATVNERVKGREGFRPFAPAVLAADAHRWFELDRPAPYMVETVGVRGATTADDGAGSFAERISVDRSPLGACTHVDGSARVQTVDPATNPAFADLLAAFAARTGVPVLLNTSFNVRDEPIVGTPADALAGYRRGALDVLVVERTALVRRPARSAP